MTFLGGSIRSALLTAAILVAGPMALAKTRTVRVRLKKELNQADFKGFSLRIDRRVDLSPASLSSFRKVHVRRQKDGTWRLAWDRPVHMETLATGELNIAASTLSLNGFPVPATVRLVPNAVRGFDVIADLPLETYLAGVLPSEMPARWPIEALKAQAVAARSFAVASLAEHKSRTYDVDSTVFDQVYRFLETTSESEARQSRVARALLQTKGRVLYDEQGHIVKALYHADCGGETETPDHVWHSKAGADVYKMQPCPVSQHAHWKLVLPKSYVSRTLARKLGFSQKSVLKTVLIASRTPSDRADQIEVWFEGRTARTVSAQEFRKIFGFSKVRSANFHMRWLGAELHISGIGLGHGVGLCQQGAKGLALKGKGYLAILRYYYPGASVATLDHTTL